MRPFLALLFIALTALPAAAGPTRFDIEHDGETRQFFVEYPRGPKPAPAIVVLHGGAGTPDRIERIATFTLHDQGWAEIYPEGLDRQWNDGRTDADGQLLRKTDDLGFLRAMIEKLAGEGLIDPRRVYFAGVSNGGGMTMRVICQAPGLAAGAAVVIMNLPVGLDCPDNGPPVPMMFVLSKADPLVPYEGGPISVLGKERGSVLSAGDTLARFAFRNRCGPYEDLAMADIADDGTRVTLRAYRGCAQPLRAYLIDGAGHTWPGNRNHRWVEKLLGPTSLDISATYEIEEFFKEQAAH